jgi:hypothetical protein
MSASRWDALSDVIDVVHGNELRGILLRGTPSGKELQSSSTTSSLAPAPPRGNICPITCVHSTAGVLAKLPSRELKQTLFEVTRIASVCVAH